MADAADDFEILVVDQDDSGPVVAVLESLATGIEHQNGVEEAAVLRHASAFRKGDHVIFHFHWIILSSG
jgi:hypothetical protein